MILLKLLIFVRLTKIIQLNNNDPWTILAMLNYYRNSEKKNKIVEITEFDYKGQGF